MSTPFLICSITRTSPTQPVLVCDATGRINHVCEALAESFGFTAKQIMQQGNMLPFIPEVIGQLHMSYLMVSQGTLSCAGVVAFQGRHVVASSEQHTSSHDLRRGIRIQRTGHPIPAARV